MMSLKSWMPGIGESGPNAALAIRESSYFPVSGFLNRLRPTISAVITELTWTVK